MATPAAMQAQSSLSAFQMSQIDELRGTARFMGMAGAFGALGGDLSTLNQNPAGLGVYTGSEIGATLDIDMQRMSFGNANPLKQTRAACNNFGYVGSAYTGADVMSYVSWGASYSRRHSFERHYSGYIPALSTSMTNWMAATSQKYAPGEMWGGLEGDPDGAFDPFFETDVPWTNLLGYNCFLFNSDEANSPYRGLFATGSEGDATIDVRQRGYTDEYAINFAGNVLNTVYWGLGFGIVDTNFTSETYYDEEIDNALIPGPGVVDCNSIYERDRTGTARGHAGWGLENYENVSGTGFNVKVGLIFKPIQELRIGLAVHTPTWYHLTYTTNAWVDYDLQGNGYYTRGNADNNPFATTSQTSWNSSLRSPWKLMASVAGVIGGRFILSADYEYNAYPSMRLSYPDDGTYSSINQAAENQRLMEQDTKQYFQATSQLRIGAEARLNRHLSVRAGYSYKTSPTQSTAYSGDNYVYTSGSQPMVEFQGHTQYVTCGLGYRYAGFYIDAAFVHSTRQSTWQAFTDFPAATDGGYSLASLPERAPRATLTDTRNQLVFSLGFKF